MPALLTVAVIAGAGAIWARRRLSDPEGEWRKWFNARLRSKLAWGVRAFFYLTLVLWFIVYLTAGEGERGSISDLLKGFSQSFGGSGKVAK